VEGWGEWECGREKGRAEGREEMDGKGKCNNGTDTKGEMGEMGEIKGERG